MLRITSMMRRRAAPLAVALALGWPASASADELDDADELEVEIDDADALDKEWPRPEEGIDSYSPFRRVCTDGDDDITDRRGRCQFEEWSDGLLYTSFMFAAMPVALYSFGDGADKGLSAEPVLSYAIAAGVNFGITELIKRFVLRPRPMTYYEGYRTRWKGVRRVHRRSMPSGHTSSTAVNMFYASTAFLIHHDGITEEVRFGAGGGMLAFSLLYTATVAALRVRSGWHYPSDVLIGGLIGTAVGVVVPVVSHEIWPEQLTQDSRENVGSAPAMISVPF